MKIDKEQLKLKEIELYSDYQKNLRQLRYDFLISHNKIRTGDIIKDHIEKVQVQEIIGMYNHTDPSLIFDGLIINANGKPNKALKKRIVYGCNVTD